MWVGVVAAGADVAGTSGATLLTGGRVGGWGVNTVKLLYDSGWQKASLTNSPCLMRHTVTIQRFVKDLRRSDCSI